MVMQNVNVTCALLCIGIKPIFLCLTSIFHSNCNGYILHSSVLTHNVIYHREPSKTTRSGVNEDSARQPWKQTYIENQTNNIFFLTASSGTENRMQLLHKVSSSKKQCAYSDEDRGKRDDVDPTSTVLHIFSSVFIHVHMLINPYAL